MLHLEANLVHPEKEIGLEHEHLAIDYQPFEFKSHNVTLWLPSRAVYLTFLHGRLYHYRHQITDYIGFNADVKSQVSAPDSKKEKRRKDHPG